MDINYKDLSIDTLYTFLAKKKVVIYGAGKIGKSLIYALSSMNIAVYQIWDNKLGGIEKLDDYDIVKPNLEVESKDELAIIVTIYAQNISKDIAKKLDSIGFKNVLYERVVINKILYQKCEQELESGKFRFDLNKCHLCPVSKDVEKRCNIYDEYVEQELISSKKDKKTGIIIPSMGVLVSNKCNLTCKGCNQLRDTYQPSDNIDISADDILFDLMKISNAVDKIEKVVVVGGESLLHKDIKSIIQRIMKIDNIGIIQLITNGTIIPKDNKIFELLSNSRVKVEVSGYGDFLPEKLQLNVEKFLQNLKDYNVNFDYVKTLQWFDFGDFERRNYSKDGWQDVYNTCCFISNDLFNGELHKCARSVFGKHLHKISEFKNDFVNIRETSEEELPKKIASFLNNTLPNICQYCNGTSSLTIPAGEQV
jgi:organic radical activating enzyme